MTQIVHCDGGSRGNPGLSAAAFFIPSLDVKVGVPLQDSTNNVAEYRGLIEALKYSSKVFGYDTHLEIRSDSKLMVEQMKGTFQVKSEGLLPLWAEAMILSEKFIQVSYVHVPRKENTVADHIANLTMDRMASHDVKEPIHWKTL
jgi:ribonuclease HI